MAVIINDFEVVVEPPATPSEEQPAGPADEGVAPQRLTPHDFDNIFRQRVERSLRVRAH
jgi:hypothetical protein